MDRTTKAVQRCAERMFAVYKATRQELSDNVTPEEETAAYDRVVDDVGYRAYVQRYGQASWDRRRGASVRGVS